MSYDETEVANISPNRTLKSVIAVRVSRRDVIAGVGSAAALSIFGGCGSFEESSRNVDGDAADGLALGFIPVAKNIDDTITLPKGYSYDVLYAMGDPIAPHVGNFSNDGTDDAASFEFRGGDHHDGMWFFGMDTNGRHVRDASDRGLLCLNHEAISSMYLHPTGQTISEGARTEADEVMREFYAHGVTVLEVVRETRRDPASASGPFRGRFHPTARSADWDYQQHSRYNRRIHALTDMIITGPAARSRFMITKHSPDGTRTRGTVNNCANGHTPWGTYLTCEENFAGYFRRIRRVDDPRRTDHELASLRRYGVAGPGRELWATVTPDTADDIFGRWNAEKLGSTADGSDDYRNVANTYGWVVEIDPFDPHSIPRKRTALGRFSHEGAELGPVRPGEPLVFYMGDDAGDEYIYKFVSRYPWDPRDGNSGLAAGNKYLDEGILYAAQFLPDGSGQWLELEYGRNGIGPEYSRYAFTDQGDVLVNARHAADCVGATKMDRPEWAAVNSKNGEVYFTLTNNGVLRSIDAVDAANPRSFRSGQDSLGNAYGHVIRWAEDGGYADALSFRWDVYLFGSRATEPSENVNLSELTEGNDFSSPDGARFSSAVPGLLWLQTDGAISGITNNMMLAAIPGHAGDGAARMVTNSDGVDSSTVTTYVGRCDGEEKVRRFLVGPKRCEITGVTETPDGRTLFVNVSHPGIEGNVDYTNRDFRSHWPDGGLSRPRSATIVITRDDGGIIGVE